MSMFNNKRWEEAQKAEGSLWEVAIHEDHDNFTPEDLGKEYLPIIKQIQITKESKILDVGGGTYPLIRLFPKCNKFYIDPLFNFYKKNKLINTESMSDINFLNEKAEELPFKDKEFDVIVCRNVLDHTINPNKTMNEIKRVLKDEGIFIFSVNTYSKPIVLLKRLFEKHVSFLRENPHPFFYSDTDVIQIFKDKDFVINYQQTLLSENYRVNLSNKKGIRLIGAHFLNLLYFIDRLKNNNKQFSEIVYILIKKEVDNYEFESLL